MEKIYEIGIYLTQYPRITILFFISSFRFFFVVWTLWYQENKIKPVYKRMYLFCSLNGIYKELQIEYTTFKTILISMTIGKFSYVFYAALLILFWPEITTIAYGIVIVVLEMSLMACILICAYCVGPILFAIIAGILPFLTLGLLICTILSISNQ